MGIALGLWRVGTRVSPSESGPVDGHSIRTGALHALFSAAARRQSSGGASRPPARLAPSRSRPLNPVPYTGILSGREPFMRSSRPRRGGSPPAALPALLRASHLLGLALGSAFGRLRAVRETRERQS